MGKTADQLIRPRPDGSVPLLLCAGPFCCPWTWPSDVQRPEWADTLALEGGEAMPDHNPRPGAAIAVPAWLRTPGPPAFTWRELTADETGLVTPPAAGHWQAGMTQWVLAAFYLTLHKARTLRILVEIENTPEGAAEFIVYFDGRPAAMRAPSATLGDGVAAESGFHTVLAKLIAHEGTPRFRLRLASEDGAPLTSAHVRTAPRPGYRGTSAKRGKRKRAEARESIGTIVSEWTGAPGEMTERDWRKVPALGAFTSGRGTLERWPTEIRAVFTPSALVFHARCMSQADPPPALPLPWLGDHIRLVVDAAHEHNACVIVIVNSSGQWMAVQKRSAGRIETLSEVKVTPLSWASGWGAVATLPFRCLGACPGSGRIVGFNAVRCCPRSADGFCTWSPPAEHAADPLSPTRDPITGLDALAVLPPWIAASQPAGAGHLQLRSEAESLPTLERGRLTERTGGALCFEGTLSGSPRTVRPTIRFDLSGAGAEQSGSWHLKLCRYDKLAFSRPLPRCGVGPLEVALSMVVPSRENALPLARFSALRRGVLILTADDLRGGWLMADRRGEFRMARFAITGQEVFQGTLANPVRTPWPWLVYAEMDWRDCRTALSWNNHPVETRDDEVPEAALTGIHFLGTIPHAWVHPNQNEVTMLCRHTGEAAALALRRLIVVREEEVTRGAGPSGSRQRSICLPTWRARTTAPGRIKALPVSPEIPHLAPVNTITIQGDVRLEVPFILDGSAAVRSRRVEAAFTLSGRRGMTPPASACTLNGAPMTAAAADTTAPPGWERIRLRFGAEAEALRAGVNWLRVELTGPPDSLWWFHKAAVIIDTEV